MDYKKTLNLPRTDFPMKANLAGQEPERVEKWQKADLYRKVLKRRKGAVKYVLHDGPPYANGGIHIGTALNKILKDFIVKTKSGFGYESPYIPGWDCHGLPIEHKVDKELGEKKAEMSKSDIHKLCRQYAAGWIDVQRAGFKRLGVIGDWDNPYITMDYRYESVILKEFYRMLHTGGVYRGFKPVYWCTTCVTALAEAEVEYADHVSYSLFVKFPLTEKSLKKLDLPAPVNAVIWTTTPWTLPANMGISAHPEEEYSVMRVEEAGHNLAAGELLLVARPLTQSEEGKSSLREKMGIARWTEVKVIPGRELDYLTARHPFYDRESLFVLGEHVLMTDGTGLVHTAPAHGQEDYAVGQKYSLDVFNPVDDYGRFKESLPLFGGQDIHEADGKIVKLMEENGTLIAQSKIPHSYPHCWRCKNPVIYRATPQWFISMEHNGLRQKALSAIVNDVKWIPEWGANRIYSMVETRPDWCISRQRTWGVPIAVFFCRQCDALVMDKQTEDKIVRSFEEQGAASWFEHNAEHYLGKAASCPQCGSRDIRQETDILDVWFDSGVSHAAVCEVRPELGGKADMYLEGTDQHRGWFHSSLLESVATRGKAPFKEVLTHGFVVDNDLRKMSKSLGNVVTAEELVNRHGAEIIRLWVAAEDYSGDIRLSDDILKRLSESYRKIRNTARYLLGNLYDFNPAEDMVAFADLMDLDRYILLRWQDTLKKIYAGYENYQFHIFYHTFMNFCVNDLSAFYLDVVKDRIYSSGAHSRERRSAQSAIFLLVREMAVLMAPVLSFTADEIWEYLPSWENRPEYVFEEVFPSTERYADDRLREKFDKLLALRKVSNKALEMARANKEIGHPLDARLLIALKDSPEDILSIDEGLACLLIVSETELVPFEQAAGTANEEGDIVVRAVASDAPKCSRCWSHSPTVGLEKADLCHRCACVLGEE